VVYFDVEEDNDTYAEPVRCCPGCGNGLGEYALKPHALVRRAPFEEA
jgi:hypothetical protein